MNKDLISGLTTKGNGLLCGEVYLSCHDEKISRSSFAYGEKIFLIFEDISGFEKTDDYVFPGIRITVLSEAGDTILHNPDLYAENVEGFNLSPLALTTNIIMAEPIHSQSKYKLVVNIWDKQGENSITTRINLNIQ
jgi:hypothetical protein